MQPEGRKHQGIPPLERVLAGSGARLFDEDGRARPGASLLAALSCLELGLDGDEGLTAAITDRLGIEPAMFASVVEFARGVADPEAAEPLTLCAGMSCSLGGATEYHAVLLARIARQGIRRETCQVYCLNHCGRGPNLMVGQTVYCAGEQVVSSDERDWRAGNGPVPINDGGAPVRD